jgi:hypothetical protein
MAMHPVLALAWFRAEDYQRVREISDDEMMPTFADFEAKMAKAIPDLEARGIRLQKMIIDPDALLSFAKGDGGGGPIDSKMRSSFAAYLLAKQHGH